MGERREAAVRWSEERRRLTLEGEGVLEYVLRWPQVEGAGLGGRWISAYYRRLAGSWRRRWEREIYLQACLDLVRCREESRPFTPWRGELTGEVALLRDGLLSLRFTGWESRGAKPPSRVRWGDVWKVRRGRPAPWGSCWPAGGAGAGACGPPWPGRGRSGGRPGTAFWTGTG